MKDKFQKYSFLPKILFLTPLTCHAHYASSCEKSTLFKCFLVTHVYTVILLYYIWGPRPTIKWSETVNILTSESCCIMGKIIIPLVASCDHFRSQAKWPWSKMWSSICSYFGVHVKSVTIVNLGLYIHCRVCRLIWYKYWKDHDCVAEGNKIMG